MASRRASRSRCTSGFKTRSRGGAAAARGAFSPSSRRTNRSSSRALRPSASLSLSLTGIHPTRPKNSTPAAGPARPACSPRRAAPTATPCSARLPRPERSSPARLEAGAHGVDDPGPRQVPGTAGSRRVRPSSGSGRGRRIRCLLAASSGVSRVLGLARLEGGDRRFQGLQALDQGLPRHLRRPALAEHAQQSFFVRCQVWSVRHYTSSCPPTPPEPRARFQPQFTDGAAVPCISGRGRTASRESACGAVRRRSTVQIRRECPVVQQLPCIPGRTRSTAFTTGASVCSGLDRRCRSREMLAMRSQMQQ